MPGAKPPAPAPTQPPAVQPPAGPTIPPVTGTQPPGTVLVRQREALTPINKFEMNRLIHARAQELELADSPAGKNGHTVLSKTAKEVYGVKSFSDLTVEQMKELYDFMEQWKYLPKRAELGR